MAHFVTFIAGSILGVLLVIFFADYETTPVSSTELSTLSDAPLSSDSNESSAGASESARISIETSDSPTPDIKPLAVDEIGLPEKYRSMVERKLDWGVTAADLVADFDAEYRDDAWAFPMEAGLGNHVSAKLAPSGVIVEFIECRSRHCVLAGYIQDMQNDSWVTALKEIRELPWWQADGEHRVQTGFVDGVFRFITVDVRYAGSQDAQVDVAQDEASKP